MASAWALPAPPGTDSDATASGLPGPAWCLLDQEAYIRDHRSNATTAVTQTNYRDTVKVTFFADEPPRLSHFCVHIPGLSKRWDFSRKPCVLSSVDNLALIRLTFASGPGTDFFLYRAGGPGRRRRPSLEHLRPVGDYLSAVPFVAAVGILPHGGGDSSDQFVLAALSFTPVAGHYELHVFRSGQGIWTKKALVLASCCRLCNIEKAIALGRGAIGFVDLWSGILVCDVLEEDPTTRFIPMPKLLPSNVFDNHQLDAHLGEARPFRDVAFCADGLIRFAEFEGSTDRRTINGDVPEDVSTMDVLLDSDMLARAAEAKEETEQDDFEYLGWRVVTWSRTLSCTSWRKESLVHVDDIPVKNSPAHTALLAQLKRSTAPDLTLKHLYMTYPSLGLDDNHAVYLISKAKRWNRAACVVKVDMRNKTLAETSPVLRDRKPALATYISCALSKYFEYRM